MKIRRFDPDLAESVTRTGREILKTFAPLLTTNDLAAIDLANERELTNDYMLQRMFDVVITEMEAKFKLLYECYRSGHPFMTAYFIGIMRDKEIGL